MSDLRRASVFGLLLCCLGAAGCGGVSVYEVGTSIPKSGLSGIPFRMQKIQFKQTTYYDRAAEVLYRTVERVLVPDMDHLYVVEGQRNYLNPFEILKSTAVLNEDGTLKSFAFESDPQLDEAVKAVSEGAKGLIAMTGVSDMPAHVSANAVFVQVEFLDLPPSMADLSAGSISAGAPTPGQGGH